MTFEEWFANERRHDAHGHMCRDCCEGTWNAATAQARREAFEEAAKVAESEYIRGEYLIAGKDIAAAIRARGL